MLRQMILNAGEATRMTVYDMSGTHLIAEWTNPTYASWITPP